MTQPIACAPRRFPLTASWRFQIINVQSRSISHPPPPTVDRTAFNKVAYPLIRPTERRETVKKSTRISKISIWTPAAFCAILSGMKMFMPDGTGDPAFYSFLPMCFFFVAAVHHSLWKRIETLETALRENVAQTGETRGA